MIGSSSSSDVRLLTIGRFRLDPLVNLAFLHPDEVGDVAQVFLVDAVVRFFLHHRLGAEGHTETRTLQHRDVVCSVADGNHLINMATLYVRDHLHQRPLALRRNDRPHGRAGKISVSVLLEVVRKGIIKLEGLLHVPRDRQESPTDDRHLVAPVLESRAKLLVQQDVLPGPSDNCMKEDEIN